MINDNNQIIWWESEKKYVKDFLNFYLPHSFNPLLSKEEEKDIRKRGWYSSWISIFSPTSGSIDILLAKARSLRQLGACFASDFPENTVFGYRFRPCVISRYKTGLPACPRWHRQVQQCRYLPNIYRYQVFSCLLVLALSLSESLPLRACLWYLLLLQPD